LTTDRVPRRLWTPVAVAAIAASLGLAACGGGDDDESTTAAETTTEATGGGGAETVSMKATDFKFTPDDPSVKAGEATFELTNDGEVVHNITIEGPSGDAELPKDIAAGESGQVDVDLSEPGTYEFYCPVGNHADLGMVGQVKVQ
jgi:plastocyanin